MEDSKIMMNKNANDFIEKLIDDMIKEPEFADKIIKAILLSDKTTKEDDKNDNRKN